MNERAGTIQDDGSREIERTITEASSAQNDAGELVDLHTEQAIIVNIAGRRVFGREAFRDAMSKALASPFADVTTTVEIEDIRMLTAQVCIVSCSKRVHDGRTENTRNPLPEEGVLTYVLVNDGDRWRIALAQTTPVAP